MTTKGSGEATARIAVRPETLTMIRKIAHGMDASQDQVIAMLVKTVRHQRESEHQLGERLAASVDKDK